MMNQRFLSPWHDCSALSLGICPERGLSVSVSTVGGLEEIKMELFKKKHLIQSYHMILITLLHVFCCLFSLSSEYPDSSWTKMLAKAKIVFYYVIMVLRLNQRGNNTNTNILPQNISFSESPNNT